MPGKNANPLEEIGTPTKPELVVFFVIDRSYSMEGARINSVNTAMREVIPVLRGVGGADASLKIAVLTFSAGAEWMYPKPVAVEDFKWNQLDVHGWTDFGAACNELCKKMSRSEFMASKVGYKKPIVILITDGAPTDADIWPGALKALKENKWFKFAIKFALSVDEADEDVLREFIGMKGNEGIYPIGDDAEKLKKLIKIVTVTSSEIGSKSMPIDIDAAGGDLDQQDAERTYAAVDAATVEDVEDEEDWK